MSDDQFGERPDTDQTPSIGLQIVFGILVAGFVHAAALFADLGALDAFANSKGNELPIFVIGVVVDILVSVAIVISQARKRRGWFIGTFIAISAILFLAIGSCAFMLSGMSRH